MAGQMVRDDDKKYLAPLCDKSYIGRVLSGEEQLTFKDFTWLNGLLFEVNKSEYVPLRKFSDSRCMDLYEQLRKRERIVIAGMTITPKVARDTIS